MVLLFLYKTLTDVFTVVNVRTSLKLTVLRFHGHKHKGKGEQRRQHLMRRSLNHGRQEADNDLEMV